MKLNMIAQRLNLSESTVSRALNDYRDISADTKALVRKTAAELGYMPNMHARRLASGNADTIAYVMPRSDGQLNASFLGELMTGMAEALTARGWDLSVLVPRSVDEELEMFRNISRTRHVSGLVEVVTASCDASASIRAEDRRAGSKSLRAASAMVIQVSPTKARLPSWVTGAMGAAAGGGVCGARAGARTDRGLVVDDSMSSA